MDLTQAALKNKGFKRRTDNNVVFFYNKKYDLTFDIQKTDYGIIFTDRASKTKIDTYTELCDFMGVIYTNEAGKDFKTGISKLNFAQGIFENVYEENYQQDNFFITKAKAKQILEANFNKLISRPLMTTHSFEGTQPNWNYRIKKCWFIFRLFDKPNYDDPTKFECTLTFYYDYYSSGHEFTQTQDLYSFDGDFWSINRRVGSKIPLQCLLDNFSGTAKLNEEKVFTYD